MPGPEAAEALAEELVGKLKEIWQEIADKVRDDVKERVMAWLKKEDNRNKLLEELEAANSGSGAANESDLKKLQQPGCWRWGYLWEAQINNTRNKGPLVRRGRLLVSPFLYEDALYYIKCA